jgi:hypothetical protein
METVKDVISKEFRILEMLDKSDRLKYLLFSGLIKLAKIALTIYATSVGISIVSLVQWW